MWHRIRTASSSSPKTKDIDIVENGKSAIKPLKKAMSADSLSSPNQNPPAYVRKRNGSLDVSLSSNCYWFINDNDKLPTIEQSPASQENTYAIALIGKPSVGKSTIVRTGLNNLAPIRNVGVEQNIIHAPTLITEIEVDDHAYPVEILEVQENVFDMKSSPRWPRGLPEIDGILVCYDVTSRASIANIAWLLNAFKEFQIPSILVACKTDCAPLDRQVETDYGEKLAILFDVGFVELDTRTDHGIQKIRDVFSMLLRLSIRHREFIRERSKQESDLSSDFSFSSRVCSDANSDKLSMNHRRTSSDLSHESRGRRLISAIRHIGLRSNRHGVESRKSRSPLNKPSSDDEGSSTRSPSRSLSRSIPRSSFSSQSTATTPSHTPPKSSILSQVCSLNPNKQSSVERNSYRRSFRPSSTLLQVMESEEEKDTAIAIKGHCRVSCGSYDSTISSVSTKSDNSLTFDGILVCDLTDKGQNKCIGSRKIGYTVDELIEMLTAGGGQHGTHDDPYTITFFVLYRKFMRPRDVLDKLMKRFSECEHDMKDRRNVTHEKICNLLYYWITNHPHDLIHPKTRQMMRGFYEIITNCQHLTFYAVFLDPPINGTVPKEDPDILWGLSDNEYYEQLVKDEAEENGEPPSMTTPYAAKKDSGFYGDNNLSDFSTTTTTSAQSSNCSIRCSHKPSLIIVASGIMGRPTSQMTFEELPERAIANELTYQEFQLFQKITGRDMLRHIWTPSGNPQHEKGRVAKSIKHFNFISSWVATMILSQDKLKTRATMLKKFMKVAVIVRESNNYNTLMAIIAAINSAPIARLRRTREFLKGKCSYKKFHNLEVLMSTDKSFGNYRLALKAPSRGQDEQKGIPYLGIHLQDLLSIGEGNRNFQESGKVHWNKFALMGEITSMICKYQKTSYNIKSNKFIGKFINDTVVMNEDELYNKSLELEPRVQRAASTSRMRRQFK